MQPIKIADLRLFEHDSKEKIIGEARRHPIGTGVIYATGLFVSLLLVFLTYMLVSNRESIYTTVGGTPPSNIIAIATIVIVILLLLIIAGTIIATKVYYQNYLVLTDQKVIVVHTFSVIDRKVAKLSIGDVQDMAVVQSTLWSRLFNYGKLTIETSGEQANMKMGMIKNPFEVSKAITNMHETNMKLYGN